MKYLIYNRRDEVRGRDSSILWWLPNAAGYTDDVKQAGRYSQCDAAQRCRDQRELVIVAEAFVFTLGELIKVTKLQRSHEPNGRCLPQ
jgi:hypothetical protein